MEFGSDSEYSASMKNDRLRDDRTILIAAIFLLSVFIYERYWLGVDTLGSSAWFQGSLPTVLAVVVFAVVSLVEYSYVGATGHGGSSKEEASVPLFMIGLGDRKVDTGYRASHASLFTALLDLMNVPESSRSYQYERSLLTASKTDSSQRFFSLGDGRKVPFD